MAVDDSDPMDLIPIAFNVYDLLQDHYARIEAYNVMTRAARAAAGVAPPPAVHGAVKGVNPNLRPETQALRAARQPIKTSTPVKAMSKPMLTPHSSPGPSSVTSTPDKFYTPQCHSSANLHQTILEPNCRKQLGRINHYMHCQIKLVNNLQQTFGLNPLKLQFNDKLPAQTENNSSIFVPSSALRPMPMQLAPQLQGQLVKPQDQEMAPEIDPNMEIPLHETSVEAMFRAPELKDFTLPPTLSQHLEGKTILAQTMPRQAEIDRLMKQINRKILTQTRLPSSMKDLEAAYCGSSAFKDVFQYLRYNKLPSSRNLAKRVQTTAQDYYVIGSILFKYITLKSGELDSVMCIPPSKMDNILDYYHDKIIAGHQGMTKTLKTLSSRFYCPRMADYIRAYIVGCHICQLFQELQKIS